MRLPVVSENWTGAIMREGRRTTAWLPHSTTIGARTECPSCDDPASQVMI
jgi:hypothetical protein